MREVKEELKLLFSTERRAGAQVTTLSCQSRLNDLSLWVELGSWREKDKEEETLENNFLPYALWTKESKAATRG